MPGKDFEKQVQQKMDELHFVPSDAVWQKVEIQIAAPRKRRPFLWLPFLILLSGAAVWLFYPGAGSGNNKKRPADNKTIPAAPAGGQQKNAVAIKNQTLKEIKQIDGDTAGTFKRNPPGKNDIAVAHTSSAVIPGIVQNAHKNNTRVKGNTTAAGYVSEDAPARKPARTKIAGKLPAGKPVAAGEEIIVAGNTEPLRENNKKEQSGEERKPVAAAPAPGTVNAGNTPIIANAAVTDSIKNTDKAGGINLMAKNKPAKIKRKIEWGISLDAGMSKISEGVTGLFSVTNTYNASAFSSLQNNTPNANGNNNNFTGPSDVKPGFAYTAGIFISKPVGKTSGILAGLHYSYSSTHVELGTKIDSSDGISRYHTGHSANYSNRFHFIELLVMMEKQLGTTSRFSVNGGIAFSFLAGSNALQYDAQKNIYYSDNSSINKTQWALLAGVNYRLLQNTVQLEIGPRLNYNLSNIFKKELYGSRHLLFAGIGTKIYFRKIKR